MSTPTNNVEPSNAAVTEEAPRGSSEDTAAAVKLLLDTLQARFQQLSDRIISRIDDMGNRIDDLEKSIAVLMKDSEENQSTAGSLTSSPSGKLTTGTKPE